MPNDDPRRRPPRDGMRDPRNPRRDARDARGPRDLRGTRDPREFTGEDRMDHRLREQTRRPDEPRRESYDERGAPRRCGELSDRSETQRFGSVGLCNVALIGAAIGLILELAYILTRKDCPEFFYRLDDPHSTVAAVLGAGLVFAVALRFARIPENPIARNLVMTLFIAIVGLAAFASSSAVSAMIRGANDPFFGCWTF